MTLYLVTDESNVEWNVLVEMSEAQAELVEDGGYTVDPLDPKRAISFAAFAAEYFDGE